MPNRLIDATSPYLLQHAGNPVDWYEWGPEALARAREENKPILLSIGYAACHWCHVMERESFENQHTASIMNKHFVCIKVDREERPDLDAIYMDAVQVMTGHGGWPMTMFCTPDGHPFYGGTYYPPEDRHGMPSFGRVLLAVATGWETQRDDLIKQGSSLTERLAGIDSEHAGSGSLDAIVLHQAFQRMREAFDAQWGGFGRAPKFPQPMSLDFLLRCIRRGFEGADAMLATTLARMACGGIFDQAGGGFHRYSVDAVWLVPHFEKMLYDNAQLLRLYARAAVVAESGRGGALGPGLMLWHRTATATGDWLLREMRHAAGGFYSSQDADSDGVEGKFYVWDYDDFVRVSGEDARAAGAMLGVTKDGNFEETNVLWMQHPPAQVAKALDLTVEALDAATRRALKALAAAREARVRPGTDDKILAAWNGLAISGLVEAGRLLRRSDFVEAGVQACDFVLREMQDVSGRLQRSWREGRTSGPAFLDDHALMAAACLDLYETTFEDRYFLTAQRFADTMIELFSDPAGGFFDTGSDQETLVRRPKDMFDNAVPSGSATAASVLGRLGALTGDGRYTDKAVQTINLVQRVLAQSPTGFGVSLQTLDDLTTGFKEIAIGGDVHSNKGLTMAQVVWARPMMPRVLAAGSDVVPLMHGRTNDPETTAYVCEGFVCTRPLDDPAALAALLDQ